MKLFFALLKREFKLFWNNKVLRMIVLGAPLMYAILIGSVYSKGKVTDVNIIVVDEDHTSMSEKAIQMMEDNETINVAAVYNSTQDLNQHMIDHNAVAVVFIPKDFQRNVYAKRYPEIVTTINTANILTANYTATALQYCLGSLKVGIEIETLKKQGVPESIAKTQYEPFQTTFIKKYNKSSNYLYFFLPGILITVLQQVLLLGLALSFASEFENNTFKDLAMRSRSAAQLIVVKIIPYMLMALGIWFVYYLFTLIFKIPFYNNLFLFTLTGGIFVTAVCLIGILVSLALPNQLKATEVLMVIATPSFIISGYTWPREQMPTIIKYFADIIPSTHFLEIFKILTVEGGTFQQILYPLSFLMGTIVIAFTASYFILKSKMKKIKAIA